LRAEYRSRLVTGPACFAPGAASELEMRLEVLLPARDGRGWL